MTGEILADIGIYTSLVLLVAVPIAYLFAAVGDAFPQEPENEQED